MPAYPGFVGAAYEAQSPLADGERTVNWYVERTEAAGASAPLALYPTPGVDLLALAPDAPGRGTLTAQNRIFGVFGTTFCELDPVSFDVTTRGTVAADTNPATLCWNGDGGGQVFITSGDNGYIFDLQGNTFTQVRTGATTMGVHLDGYFIALDAATSTIYLSDLLDGTTWDPTQYAQRSTASDPWVSMAVLDRYLYLFGTQTSEVWYDAGAFPFPFQPHPSGLMPVGCAAPFSVRVAGNTLLWLGATRDGKGQVYRASGFTPEPAGTFALATALEQYGVVSDGIADSYTDQGHTFYLLTLPAAGVTWALDVTSTLQLDTAARWTERGTWDSAAQRFTASRVAFHLYVPFTSDHLVLDRDGAGVYRLTATSARDVTGASMRRVRRAPALFADNRWVTVPSFELLLEPGLAPAAISTTALAGVAIAGIAVCGVTAGDASDPQVSLRISPDGGKTWGTERWRSAGAQGRYGTRLRWLRNGRARRWMPEVVVSDAVPWRLLGAVVEGLSS
ncbi:MAG: hypothetical protein VW405_03115 [Rhodospirillaceae bacterium]